MIVTLQILPDDSNVSMVLRFDLNELYKEAVSNVFGSRYGNAVPQEILTPEEQRYFGAHYTDEQNIFKVIRPLFLNELSLAYAVGSVSSMTKNRFLEKLSQLTFFDPAAGCGNFLLLAYRELRLLELAVLETLPPEERIVRVHPGQFFGIELLPFPLQIAETAFRLAEDRLNDGAMRRLGIEKRSLPKRRPPTLVQGNALHVDWTDILPKEKCSVILGNPPYIGAKLLNAEQRQDTRRILGHLKQAGLLDYAACWFVKTAEYIRNTSVRVGFVTTSSIIQGEQVGVLWPELFRHKVAIDFGYTPFIWTSDVKKKAHVHCVIIGFRSDHFDKMAILPKTPVKTIFYAAKDGKIVTKTAEVIGPYLIADSMVIVQNRTKPIAPVPEIRFGNQPIDGGHLLLNRDERDQLLRKHPAAASLIRPYIGGYEFLNRSERFCLWLKDADPAVVHSVPEIKRRMEAVREYRLNSKRLMTRRLAEQPGLFAFISHPNEPYLLIPATTSESREYLPIGFFTPETIASNAALIVPGASLFHFGVLTSAMHNAWMRRVCGRLEVDYRYSARIVYNNFPWPQEEKHRNVAIERVSQRILDIRNEYPGDSYVKLYHPRQMPENLRQAHHALDALVDQLYRRKPFENDEERVTFLFGFIAEARR